MPFTHSKIEHKGKRREENRNEVFAFIRFAYW